MKFYSNLFFTVFLIFFVSCATQKKEEPMTPAMQEKEIYDQAQERIKSKNYSMAIDALESLERSLLSCFSIEKPPPLLSSKALLLGIDEQATVPLGEYSSQLQKTVSLILHSL